MGYLSKSDDHLTTFLSNCRGRSILGRDRAIKLIHKYYPEESTASKALIIHGDAISRKAKRVFQINKNLDADENLIEEAAYLHDIGVLETRAPSIGCHGNRTYLEHGIIGRAILQKEGLEKHALIAERHIGVGITIDDIIKQHLPLPKRDMVPETIEEQLICFLDLFFSKSLDPHPAEKSKSRIRAGLARFGEQQVAVFDRWCERFGV